MKAVQMVDHWAFPRVASMAVLLAALKVDQWVYLSVDYLVAPMAVESAGLMEFPMVDH